MYTKKEMEKQLDEKEGATQLLQQIGNIIKHFRLQENMTQAKLAELCGFEKASISRIEAGKTNITMVTLLCITEALGISVTQLMNMLD